MEIKDKESLLFYGNITQLQMNEVARMNKSFESIYNYYVGDEFMYPSIEQSANEIRELQSKVESQIVSPKQEYIQQDVNLMNYLTSEAEKLNISSSDNARTLFILKEKVDPLILALKNYWNRARPYQYAYFLKSNFHPLKAVSANTPAYPSGHSIQVTCWSKMLEKKYPELQTELSNIVYSVNQGRMALGVHFPSDIQFGVSIAQYLNNKGLLL
tara:strand:+ start:363 stop:1004 length:642 start_codon:yes stop_codon:yes gene_type:complete